MALCLMVQNQQELPSLAVLRVEGGQLVIEAAVDH